MCMSGDKMDQKETSRESILLEVVIKLTGIVVELTLLQIKTSRNHKLMLDSDWSWIY